MIIKIIEEDINKVKKVLIDNGIKHEIKVEDYITWIGEFLLKSFNDFIENPEIYISREIEKKIYDKIPKMVINIETEIFKNSFSLNEKSKITLLYQYLKEYCDVYIFDEILKEKYNTKE